MSHHWRSMYSPLTRVAREILSAHNEAEVRGISVESAFEERHARTEAQQKRREQWRDEHSTRR